MEAEIIVGIDLGTTNSEVAVIRDGRPEVLSENGEAILPSVVGLDLQGKLLVGHPARNQAPLAPERTISSVKRKMGQEIKLSLGSLQFTPQEVSAVILRTLKTRAEKALGRSVKKAVITVPAFFNDAQRRATREAGELAGLEVVRILSEPTAAVLTYDPHPTEHERLLVYDLGGGTFDVSLARVEGGVVEIQSSHGDVELGGDDFDQILLDHVCDQFLKEHGIDLRRSAAARARLLRAAEDAKKRLSTEPIAVVEEEFIAEKNGRPLHLAIEIARSDYENWIRPMLLRTLDCVGRALADAKVHAGQIDKVILVGGATRTPLVRELLEERLGRPVHLEIEPDLAVAMGAAVQGGLIAGVDVGPILIDITPHSLGISTLGVLNGTLSEHNFSVIIPRNTPLPTSRSEVYTTAVDNQERAQISVFQGEHADSRKNALVGDFLIEGLAPLPAGNQVLVKLDLDASGILKVTAVERATGVSKQVVISSGMERFRMSQRSDAVDRLEKVFATLGETADAIAAEEPGTLRQAIESGRSILQKARRLTAGVSPENAADLQERSDALEQALEGRSEDEIRSLARELEDLVFYLEDA